MVDKHKELISAAQPGIDELNQMLDSLHGGIMRVMSTPTNQEVIEFLAGDEPVNKFLERTKR